MSLIPRSRRRSKHESINDSDEDQEDSNLFLVAKGAILGFAGGSIKFLRGAAAMVGGFFIGPFMMGLGYNKVDILKMINSPLATWPEQIKSKWKKIPKSKGNGVWNFFKGLAKGIFIGIPVSLGSGLLALLENGLSGLWTATVGGIKLVFEAATTVKELGKEIDNNLILKGVARTNVYGTALMGLAKIAKWWDPAYGKKFEQLRKQYPNAIDTIRSKITGLIGEETQDAGKHLVENKIVEDKRKTAAQQLQHQIARVAGLSKSKISTGHDAHLHKTPLLHQRSGASTQPGTQQGESVYRQPGKKNKNKSHSLGENRPRPRPSGATKK